jgi:hypothetical protein
LAISSCMLPSSSPASNLAAATCLVSCVAGRPPSPLSPPPVSSVHSAPSLPRRLGPIAPSAAALGNRRRLLSGCDPTGGLGAAPTPNGVIEPVGNWGSQAMQRAPGCRRGAGPILLLALVALAAAAPRLVRAVTDAADGTLVHPFPASSARSELVPSVDYRFAAARASCSIVRSSGGGVGVACAGGLFVPALSVVLYCTAMRSTQAGASD